MGSSGRSDSNERALLVNPPADEYRIEVYGYGIPGDTVNVQLDIAEISGLGSMTVTGAPMSIVNGKLYPMSLHF